MKKFIAFIAVAMMFVATSCGNKVAQVEAVEEESVEVVDTLTVDTLAVDTVAVDSVLVAE